MNSLKHLSKKERSAHYAKVAALGCIITGERDVELHHCTGSAFPAKREHRPVIPLARRLHRGDYGEAIHAGKKVWEDRFGTQLELLEKVNKKLTFTD